MRILGLRLHPRLPAFRFGVAAGLLLIVSLAMFYNLARMAREGRVFALDDEELECLDSLSHDIDSVDELNREFLAIGQEKARSAAQTGRSGALSRLAQCRAMESSPAQVQEFAALELIIARERDQLNDKVDKRIGSLVREKIALRRARRLRNRRRVGAAALILTGVLALSLAILWSAFRLLSRENAAHRENAEKFAKAFYGNPVAMAIRRKDDGALVAVNRSFERLLEYDEGALIGRTIWEIGMYARPDVVSKVLVPLTEHSSFSDVEVELRTKTGGSRHVLMSGDRITLEGLPCLFGCFFDITERKRAERALVRVSELARSRSIQVRKLAESLVQAEQKERRRLSQILHDQVQQTLAAAVFHANLLSKQPGLDRDSRAKTDAVVGTLKEAIQTTRSLSFELCPPAIAEAGLDRALRWLADQMDMRYKLNVELAFEGPVPRLPSPIRDFLFSAARELLFNAVKHSGISAARVRVSRELGRVRVEVSDRGAGFDAAGLRLEDGGLGLAGIREHLALFEGELRIDSSPGQGCRVSLSLPAEPAAGDSGPDPA